MASAVAPDEAYTVDLTQAKKLIIGQWQLIQITADVPNPPVPDVRLIIDSKNQIAVIDSGKQIDKVDFDIVQTVYNLQLKTTAQPRPDNWYVRDPSLQVSQNRLYLDAGVAVDLPGYLFKRIQ